MKKVLPLAIVVFVTTTGFILTKKTVKNDFQKENILEQVANAHGLQNWSAVEEIKFTFNVDRDTSHFERTWIWKPKTNDITAITADNTLAYNWADMDSVAYKTNGSFINDKFWLLAPFQLKWDAKNLTHKHTLSEKAPISKAPMQKLTIIYGSEGGYTPGDAYDFYFGDDLIIKEWVYRKGNQEEPSMITTFEDYKDTKGLKIAQMHKMGEGNFKLYFTGVEVK